MQNPKRRPREIPERELLSQTEAAVMRGEAPPTIVERATMLSKNGVPRLHIADDLKHWGMQCSPDGRRWVLARSLGFQGLWLRTRMRLAWGVFTGRYDALEWLGQK